MRSGGSRRRHDEVRKGRKDRREGCVEYCRGKVARVAVLDLGGPSLMVMAAFGGLWCVLVALFYGLFGSIEVY